MCVYVWVGKMGCRIFSSSVSNRVQQSHGLWEEAVVEPCCYAPEAAEPPSRGQQQQQSRVGMGGVTVDVVGPGQAALFCGVLDGRK